MQLKVNGTTQNVEEECNLEALLQQLNLKADRVAVELNHNVVMLCDFCDTLLQDGDQLEIVNFVGGG